VNIEPTVHSVQPSAVFSWLLVACCLLLVACCLLLVACGVVVVVIDDQTFSIRPVRLLTLHYMRNTTTTTIEEEVEMD
jgi:hypothetical protein